MGFDGGRRGLNWSGQEAWFGLVLAGLEWPVVTGYGLIWDDLKWASGYGLIWYGVG